MVLNKRQRNRRGYPEWRQATSGYAFVTLVIPRVNLSVNYLLNDKNPCILNNSIYFPFNPSGTVFSHVFNPFM